MGSAQPIRSDTMENPAGASVGGSRKPHLPARWLGMRATTLVGRDPFSASLPYSTTRGSRCFRQRHSNAANDTQKNLHLISCHLKPLASLPGPVAPSQQANSHCSRGTTLEPSETLDLESTRASPRQDAESDPGMLLRYQSRRRWRETRHNTITSSVFVDGPDKSRVPQRLVPCTPRDEQGDQFSLTHNLRLVQEANLVHELS